MTYASNLCFIPTACTHSVSYLVNFVKLFRTLKLKYIFWFHNYDLAYFTKEGCFRVCAFAFQITEKVANRCWWFFHDSKSKHLDFGDGRLTPAWKPNLVIDRIEATGQGCRGPQIWIMNFVDFLVHSNPYCAHFNFSRKCRNRCWVRWELERSFDGQVQLCQKHSYWKLITSDMGVGTRGAEGAAAPPTFGTGEQAIALAPPKVWAFCTATLDWVESTW